MVRYLDNGKNSGFAAWAANKDQNNKGGQSLLSRILLWTGIALLAWWLAGTLVSPKKLEIKPMAMPTAEAIAADVPAQLIENDNIAATIRGLRISNIELKNFKDGAHNVTLLDGDKEFMEIGFGTQNTEVPNATTIWKNPRLTGPQVNLMWANNAGVEFLCRFEQVDGYNGQYGCKVTNKSRNPISISSYARIVRNGDEKTSATVATGGIAFANGSVHRESWDDLEKRSENFTGAGFVGFTDQYWQTIAQLNTTVLPDADNNLRLRKRTDGMFQADSGTDFVTIAPGESQEFSYFVFTGPKEAKLLSIAAPHIHGIDQTIDYGWFWFLSKPFLWALNSLHNIFGNYGIAIIILTLFLRILMWPLTRKSYSSMAAMQKMQPEMQRIQKLYGDDKIRLQQEMMNLYKTHKTSPMSGCLPMLLQIPIFFALYKTLLISVQMRSANFLWIADLSVMDPYFILPVLMAATMWWQQKLSTSANTPAMPGMGFMKWMPFIFGAMFAWMPAGLVLYWTVSNLFGIGQIYVIKKK
ncbi:membrane protein insertase YidC [Bacteroidia bacterium]|nr:membrane protein insertase YidC [Bacteroidia bacterium]